MSLKSKSGKKKPSEIDYLKDIRASVKRLEAGQRRLETWSAFHKGEHKSSARFASFVATAISTMLVAAVEYFRK